MSFWDPADRDEEQSWPRWKRMLHGVYVGALLLGFVLMIGMANGLR